MGWGLGPQAPGCGEGWAEQGQRRERVLGSGDRQARAYPWPGDGGSCLRMGNSGSLSTPCSCFSLYSFCRSTSWCRSRSLRGRRGGHLEAPWGRPLPKISHDSQFAARTRLRAARGCSTGRHWEGAGPWAGKGPRTGEEEDKFRSDGIPWQTGTVFTQWSQARREFKHWECGACGWGRQWPLGLPVMSIDPGKQRPSAQWRLEGRREGGWELVGGLPVRLLPLTWHVPCGPVAAAAGSPSSPCPGWGPQPGSCPRCPGR